eukprot:TRINITY_DN9103_c0_g3_i2.p1 TRINITY_DN9103_c0_g3~~TRINITY_DN9103_c0_g3_i2.p1  ORF type:complete len:232 (+),score=61.73 TRINITY_DN9103_c0_g3_i2:26-721(+)
MNSISVLVLSLCIVSTLATTLPEFESWKTANKISYGNPEEQAYRFNIWQRNYATILSHNDNLDSSFELSLNKFADKLPNEILGFKKLVEPALRTAVLDLTIDVPDSWDWRKHNVIPPVSDQGQCGDSDIIDICHSVQAFTAIHKQKLRIDVERVEQCFGCDGHMENTVYEFIKTCGVPLSSSTPTRTCQYSSADFHAVINGSVSVTSGDENALKLAVATEGNRDIDDTILF